MCPLKKDLWIPALGNPSIKAMDLLLSPRGIPSANKLHSCIHDFPSVCQCPTLNRNDRQAPLTFEGYLQRGSMKISRTKRGWRDQTVHVPEEKFQANEWKVFWGSNRRYCTHNTKTECFQKIKRLEKWKGSRTLKTWAKNFSKLDDKSWELPVENEKTKR